jgi:hypothetical protein
MPTTRLVRRIRADFDDGSADDVINGLNEMAASSTDPQHGSERVQAAVVLLGQGDVSRLEEATQLALADWRDVLVAAGLAAVDWRDRLDQALGSDGPE